MRNIRQESTSEADLITVFFLTERNFKDIVQNMGYHCTKGSSQFALKAALDGLSQVDCGQAENGEHQNRRETGEHSSSSADSEIQSEL